MKLEMRDPRGSENSYCLATVVQVRGCRMRICFDGTDEYGVWRMPDSEDIHPVGWCEGNGGKLQLPVGKCDIVVGENKILIEFPMNVHLFCFASIFCC